MLTVAIRTIIGYGKGVPSASRASARVFPRRNTPAPHYSVAGVDRDSGYGRALRETRVSWAGRGVGPGFARRRDLRDRMVPIFRHAAATLCCAANRGGGAGGYVHSGVSANVASTVIAVAAQFLPGSHNPGIIFRLVGLPVLFRGLGGGLAL